MTGGGGEKGRVEQLCWEGVYTGHDHKGDRDDNRDKEGGKEGGGEGGSNGPGESPESEDVFVQICSALASTATPQLSPSSLLHLVAAGCNLHRKTALSPHQAGGGGRSKEDNEVERWNVQRQVAIMGLLESACVRGGGGGGG
ncbi:hypothetical protein TrCOL_g13097, partial [Triparma columacea]